MATEDFRRIFESLRIPVAGADASGAIAFANNAFAELAGPRDSAAATIAAAASSTTTTPPAMSRRRGCSRSGPSGRGEAIRT